tara:strand:+ start:910 stop:1023 length:114 start_codon:yes stop_codon:yes gene_type:complete
MTGNHVGFSLRSSNLRLGAIPTIIIGAFMTGLALIES